MGILDDALVELEAGGLGLVPAEPAALEALEAGGLE